MMSEKIFTLLVGALICSLLLSAGCAEPVKEVAKPRLEPEEQILQVPTEEEVEPQVEIEKQLPEAPTEETATLALKFSPQDSTTYKITAEAQQSVKWEGPLPDDTTFKGGQNDTKMEMTFTQQIQSVNEKGNAVAKITIEALKYSSVIKENLVVDFDSSRAEDQDSPLAKLIGQSYTIEITPTGKVTKVIDASGAQVAVRGGPSPPITALKLLTTEAIKNRHGFIALPDADKSQLRTGENWSSTKTFLFGMMGSKSYEKIYTLKEIRDTDNRRTAIVKMNAIPTSETAEQLHKEQETSQFSKMFDTTETYTGRLKLDLTTGKIEKYLEKLQSEWIVVEPLAEQQEDKEPIILTMGALRLYSLEKID